MKLRPVQLSILLIVCCAVVMGVIETARQRRDMSTRGLILRLPALERGIQFYADTQTLRRAGLLAMLAGSRKSEELDYRRFVESVKFDYREDLDEIYGVFYGEKSNFLLRGRLSWADIRGYAERHGAECKAGYCGLEGRLPGRYLSFYPVGETVLSVAAANDIWAAQATHKIKEEPPGFWIPPQPFWVAIPGKVLANPGELPAGLAAFVSQMKDAVRMTMAIGAADDAFQAEMRARFENESAAAESRDNLEKSTRLLKTMLAREKQTPNPDDLSGLLVSGVFTREGTQVIGRWPISRAFLEAWSEGKL